MRLFGLQCATIMSQIINSFVIDFWCQEKLAYHVSLVVKRIVVNVLCEIVFDIGSNFSFFFFPWKVVKSFITAGKWSWGRRSAFSLTNNQIVSSSRKNNDRNTIKNSFFFLPIVLCLNNWFRFMSFIIAEHTLVFPR